MILLNPWEQPEEGKESKESKESKAIRIYSSRDFAWKVLKHKQPHEMPRYSHSCKALLWNLIRVCCPGYNELCGRRWAMQALLQDAGYIADVAFLSSSILLRPPLFGRRFTCLCLCVCSTSGQSLCKKLINFSVRSSNSKALSGDTANTSVTPEAKCSRWVCLAGRFRSLR